MWEIDNWIEGEKNEMVELWCSRGLDKDTATDVIDKISKHPAFFADMMMKVISLNIIFTAVLIVTLFYPRPSLDPLLSGRT